MRSKAVWIVVPSLVLLAAPAEAHFRLDSPVASLQQSADGSPQKPGSLTDSCPAGTASGLATQVRAGGTVKVKITETVAHGGHYRVAFAANKTAFTFPATVASNNQCQSTTIAPSPPPAPILADGLFLHDQTAASAKNFCNGTATCESDVSIPNVAPGNYVMQVIEWMLPHGSAANNGIYGCFYVHCANIQVVEADASIPDGGVVGLGDAGVVEPKPTTTSDASAQPGDDDDPAGTSRLRSSTPADDGCNVGSANGVSLGGSLLLALVAARLVRRKKR